ncbi:MAG: hypothetical protein EA397_05910 [Deltaproteobacteria bacterium]|nr:MAG: hypothetical protein EA397_05910 [Deltaproteobacteria bacterium]
MNLLIVESAAKARTLQKYLGKGWKVLATGGHVQTLPNDRKVHGKDASKAFWANRKGQLPSPPWVWTDRGEKAVQAILASAGDDPTFYLAPDPDREGEFIAWCLDRLLCEHGPTHRVTFQEVTREAVERAIASPREVDLAMVESALVRKFLDRLVGYRTSKLARGMLPGGRASMGRVQTPTLGFVVERELEREAHVPIPYFELRAQAEGVDLQARFHEPTDADVWRDDAGKPVPTRTFDGALAQRGETALREHGLVLLTEVKEGSRTARPKPPFSTDALLQAAGSRFGWSPKKTSALASALYEAGHITYIRTDSNRLADSAIIAARQVIHEAFGEDHLGAGAKAKPSTGPVQDAHEAIRPTDLAVADLDLDDADARRLYRLIRAQTLGSQMAPSARTILSIRGAVQGFERPLTGSVSWRTFAGFEAAFAEFQEAPPTGPPSIELSPGAKWSLDPATEAQDNPVLIEDATRPPPRYRPHTLVKAMKDGGIGRPSTYARTVEKLEERGYLHTEEGGLAPTERGRAAWLDVAPMYAEDGTEVDLFSAEFTATMEERLDAVARGEEPAATTWEQWRDQIRALHELARERLKRGQITPGLRQRLTRLLDNAPEDIERPQAIDALSWAEARAWIDRLHKAGVAPSPTERQRAHLDKLLAELELDPAEIVEILGVEDPSKLRTTTQMSAAIDAVQQLHDERRPPSRKQVALIERLREKAGLSPTQAAALAGLQDLTELTGGREGSASTVIDALLEKTGKKPRRPQRTL